MLNRYSLSLLGLLAGAACASPNYTTTATAPQSGSIGATELTSAGASNVYDAIIRLRPSFLASRGATSFLNEPSAAVVVVVNQIVRGGLEELRAIDPNIVRSIRRLSAAEVFQITGRSAPSGGIQVLMGGP